MSKQFILILICVRFHLWNNEKNQNENEYKKKKMRIKRIKY